MPEDPNEGYYSKDDDGWVPQPEGTKRIVITMNVPADWDKYDLADLVQAAARASGHPDSDVTVWNSARDFVSDWEEGVA